MQNYMSENIFDIMGTLIELYLIPKILGSQNNASQLDGYQFVISVIPAKIISVDCIRAIGMSIKR